MSTQSNGDGNGDGDGDGNGDDGGERLLLSVGDASLNLLCSVIGYYTVAYIISGIIGPAFR